MSDESRTPRPRKEKTPEDTKETAPEKKPLDREIYDLIGKMLDERGINKAVFLMDIEGQLGVYYRGHFYDAAQLLTEAHRRFLAKVEKDLAP